ncbi:MAG: hypothetical protein WCK18_00635 [Prolixibacteraceae bacterium]
MSNLRSFLIRFRKNTMLTRNGFTTSHSDGFMLYYYDKEMRAPYLRRGLRRGIKL